jgi:hypothetical protein
MEADGFGQSFDRHGRESIDAPVTGFTRALSGGEKLVGAFELRH